MPLEAPGGGLYHVEHATTGHGGLYDVADVSGLWAVSWWMPSSRWWIVSCGICHNWTWWIV